jgi:hypothetical protein
MRCTGQCGSYGSLRTTHKRRWSTGFFWTQPSPPTTTSCQPSSFKTHHHPHSLCHPQRVTKTRWGICLCYAEPPPPPTSPRDSLVAFLNSTGLQNPPTPPTSHGDSLGVRLCNPGSPPPPTSPRDSLVALLGPHLPSPPTTGPRHPPPAFKTHQHPQRVTETRWGFVYAARDLHHHQRVPETRWGLFLDPLPNDTRPQPADGWPTQHMNCERVRGGAYGQRGRG